MSLLPIRSNLVAERVSFLAQLLHLNDAEYSFEASIENAILTGQEEEEPSPATPLQLFSSSSEMQTESVDLFRSSPLSLEPHPPPTCVISALAYLYPSSPSPSRSPSPISCDPVSVNVSPMSCDRASVEEPKVPYIFQTNKTDNSRQRSNKKKSKANKRKARRAAALLKDAMHHKIKPSLSKRHLSLSKAKTTAYSMSEMPATSTMYTGRHSKPRAGSDLERLIDEKGFELVEWNGMYVRSLIVHSASIYFLCLRKANHANCKPRNDYWRACRIPKTT